MKIGISVIIFAAGLGIGLGTPFFAPRYVEPYLPKVLKANRASVEGEVVRKQRENDRLLLTISTPGGALLATFKKKITEIDLLIEEGDLVTLGLGQYEPFVDDPSIEGVMKQEFLPESTQESLRMTPSDPSEIEGSLPMRESAP